MYVTEASTTRLEHMLSSLFDLVPQEHSLKVTRGDIQLLRAPSELPQRKLLARLRNLGYIPETVDVAVAHVCVVETILICKQCVVSAAGSQLTMLYHWKGDASAPT